MLITGDSVIVETDYPGCILDRDKVRLYSQSANSLARPQYLGEQRVIQVSSRFSTKEHSNVDQIKTLNKIKMFIDFYFLIQRA